MKAESPIVTGERRLPTCPQVPPPTPEAEPSSAVQELDLRTVMRGLISHENELTNHRLMWLLLSQGLIANACINAGPKGEAVVEALGIVGIIISFSAFLVLYKSYQARGYLEFLGRKAERGMLRGDLVPLLGWPRTRVAGWRDEAWTCPWLRQYSDVLEPYLLLPPLITSAWLLFLMPHRFPTGIPARLLLAIAVALVLHGTICFLWVRAEVRDETLAGGAAPGETGADRRHHPAAGK